MPGRTVEPLRSSPDVDVVLPGSKSITNRALLAAGLAQGRSQLSQVLLADDTEAMLDCIRSLGAEISLDEESATASITGVSGRLPPGGSCFARQSGTTARFVAPVLALGGGLWHLDGDEQLRARPMEDLFTALRELGADVSAPPAGFSLPVSICGPFTKDRAKVSGKTSSQFLSGLLLAAPISPKGLSIEVTGSLVSAPYVAMTLSVMVQFGAEVHDEAGCYRVAPGGYSSATFGIEPDASAASYFFAAGALSRGRVGVKGLGTTSVQGDLAFVDVLAAMGATVNKGQDFTEVRGSGELHGVQVDCREFSDTVPTLAVVAALADSPTEITGVGFIRGKESDRIGAVVRELRRCGIDAREDADGMTIQPSKAHSARVRSYGDHRLAMAFAVMGLFVEGIEIDDPECVTKTFPDFFAALDQLRR